MKVPAAPATATATAAVITAGTHPTLGCAQGILRGYDQTTNVILEDCCELVFSTTVSCSGLPMISALHHQTVYDLSVELTIYCLHPLLL
jgi:hypothetical protein